MTQQSYKYDSYGHHIPGGTEVNVDTFGLTDSTWTAITAGCKQFIAKTRSTSNFKVSDSSVGTDYITFSELNLEINSSGLLFYTQSVSATDILELLYTD